MVYIPDLLLFLHFHYIFVRSALEIDRERIEYDASATMRNALYNALRRYIVKFS